MKKVQPVEEDEKVSSNRRCHPGRRAVSFLSYKLMWEIMSEDRL